MVEEAKYARTTITVPPDLKRRMEAVEEEVNWSAEACRAFEAKLAEIASRKERKTMDDIIVRLRVSKQREEDAEYHEGATRGRQWAESKASAYDLIRLEQCRQRHATDWEHFFSSNPAETLAHVIFRPEDFFTVGATEEFWRSALGEERHVNFFMPDSDSFARGFAEGALSLWLEVKDQI